MRSDAELYPLNLAVVYESCICRKKRHKVAEAASHRFAPESSVANQHHVAEIACFAQLIVIRL